jgi:hypothetical protein
VGTDESPLLIPAIRPPRRRLVRTAKHLPALVYTVYICPRYEFRRTLKSASKH